MIEIKNNEIKEDNNLKEQIIELKEKKEEENKIKELEESQKKINENFQLKISSLENEKDKIIKEKETLEN